MTNGSYRKPQADIYTLLLVLALVAIIVATVFLYLETSDYGSPPYQNSSILRGGPTLVLGHPRASDAGCPALFGDGSVLT
jgi:hypothetical protein